MQQYERSCVTTADANTPNIYKAKLILKHVLAKNMLRSIEGCNYLLNIGCRMRTLIYNH